MNLKTMASKIDFSAVLEYHEPKPKHKKEGFDFSKAMEYHEPEPITAFQPEFSLFPEKKADMSIWHKKQKEGAGVDFGVTINPECEIVITEVWYRKLPPIVITEKDIERWALFGAPWY